VAVFENTVLREILGAKEQRVRGGSRNCFMRNFTIYNKNVNKVHTFTGTEALYRP
jgi:hypothetical protein